jgi:hypothetical protein
MLYSRLRNFHAAEPYNTPFSSASTPFHVSELAPAPSQITLTLGDILPILVDAVRQRRAWVQDFLDDEITLSRDLYEVLLAYEQQRHLEE